MPPTITATATAPCPGLARREQTMAPAPKKAPWGSPEIKRAASRIWYSGESAASRLPMKIVAASMSMSFFNGIRLSAISSGDPTATPREYADMRCPPSTMLTPIPLATSLRMPIMPNSAIPSANVPIASDMMLLFMSDPFFSAQS